MSELSPEEIRRRTEERDRLLLEKARVDEDPTGNEVDITINGVRITYSRGQNNEPKYEWASKNPLSNEEKRLSLRAAKTYFEENKKAA